MSNPQFKKLFEPGRIGQMVLKNRTVMSPMGTDLCDEKGYINQRIKDYYEERARGGVGLLIIEAPAVDFRGRRRFTEITLADDSYIPGFRELAEVVHKHGAKIALQLLHRGREARAIVTGQQPVAPSPVPAAGGEVPHELTLNEIAEIVGRFAAAARRTKEAGCDGVEIHSAHGYLISEFLSSAANRRTDRYGGMVENKARFLIEIIRAVRETVGPDYPLWCRLSAEEYGVEDGITLEETKQVARMAVEAGVDAIHVSAFGYGSYAATAFPESPGLLVPLAEEVKKTVNVPVIAVGWLKPEVGEQVLEEGKADFIAIGRGLLADPEIVSKAASGRLEDINPCIGCIECIDAISSFQAVRCAVNPALGREKEYRIQRAGGVKKVVVIGGGPAGMEAARVAGLRGHKVVLFEREFSLGGRLKLAALPPHKEAILDLIGYLAKQVAKAGVEVRLGTEATAELIAENEPDAVVVATGAIPSIPRIRGIGSPNVFTAEDVLTGKAQVGQNVVIIGGGLVGCETGHFLADKGKTVTILEMMESMALDMIAPVRQRLLDRLMKKGVRLLTSIQCDEVIDGGLTLTTKEGKQETILADTTVLAVGFNPNPGLFQSLQGKVPETYHIGDSSQPARILEAIHSGSSTGRAI